MLYRKIKIRFLALICYLLIESISFGINTDTVQMEKKEYEQELKKIKTLNKSFENGPVININEYKKSANRIQEGWKKRNKAHYANLMLEICKPLSSGCFDDERQYSLARQYALSALEEPNEVPLDIELQLIGHVMTDMITPRAPKDQDWTQRRTKDMEVRLHAWKRLTDAIDPNWDPNDLPVSNVIPPLATGLPSGIAPEAIEDPNLRAQYEVAIEKNRQKAERYNEQYSLRKWLKRFPPRAEKYIVRAYSKPPFNLEELKKYLKKYNIDEKIQEKILGAVEENMQKQSQEKPSTQ